MQMSNFLRTVFKLDSASCLGMAALVLPLAGALQAPLGIDAAILAAAAASLVPIGLFILWLGMRREAAMGLVWLVILGNLGWVVASFAAAADLPAITPIGQAAVIVQAFVVLGLAVAEWAGLRAKTTELA